MSFLAAFKIVLPIILPVVVGWIIVKARILKRGDATVLTTFFMWIAAPAVIIFLLAPAKLGELIDPRFIAAMVVGILVLYGATLAAEIFFAHQSLPEAAFAAMCVAAFNSVIVGLPVLVQVMGHRAIVPVLIDVVVLLVVVVPLTTALASTGAGERVGVWSSVRDGLVGTAKNPLVGATVIGLILSGAEVTLPSWLNEFFRLMSGALVGTALVAIGMTLDFSSMRADIGQVSLLTVARLVVSPALAIGLALLLDVPPVFSIALVVLFALPTAKLVFAMSNAAGHFNHEASAIVTVTTVAAVVVLPAAVAVSTAIWPGAVPGG